MADSGIVAGFGGRAAVPAPDAVVALETRALLGEGPVWDDRSKLLLWVDILEGIVHRFDPGSGEDRSFAVGQPVGFVAPRAAGGVIVGLRDGIAVIDEDWCDLELVVEVEIDDPGTRFNDGSCDSAGRLFAGTMAFDETAGSGALYRLEGDELSVVEPTVTVSNGIDWNPEYTSMYYVDSATRRIDRFRYDLATGTASERTPFVEIAEGDGAPDGLCVDAEGFVWLALFGGWSVRRYSPAGELVQVVGLPVANVTACAFGGPALSELFVTTARAGLSDEQLDEQPLAGSLFQVSPATTGRAGALFGPRGAS